MMEVLDDVHPDEGTIHAWLDGELNMAEAARLEAHVATCDSCRVRVAEARGLVAGASRVVSLLDDAPAPLIRQATLAVPRQGASLWRTLRVTPSRASIAAMLIVAIGLVLTREHGALDSEFVPSDTVARGKTNGATHAHVAVTTAAPTLGDSVLKSAIARKLASEQPARTIQRSPGVDVPSSPMIAGGVAHLNSAPAAQVAIARATERADAETTGARADRTRVGDAPNALAVRELSAARAADSVARSALSGRAPGVAGSIAAGECYRLESTASSAAWGPVSLPLIIAVDSAGHGARVLTATGAETQARAALSYDGLDSAVFLLRRIGYAGALTLSATGANRIGTMRSNTETMQLSEVVGHGAPALQAHGLGQHVGGDEGIAVAVAADP